MLLMMSMIFSTNPETKLVIAEKTLLIVDDSVCIPAMIEFCCASGAFLPRSIAAWYAVSMVLAASALAWSLCAVMRAMKSLGAAEFVLLSDSTEQAVVMSVF